MHTLLSLPHRLNRLRRRRDEIAAWRIRESLPVERWTFDGERIAPGERWPSISGVHLFASEPFEVPAHWPLSDTRLELDVGGESLLKLRYASGAETAHGLDLHHTRFRLDERAASATIEAVAKGPFGTMSEARFQQAELILIEEGVVVLARTLALIADAAQHLKDHEVTPFLLELGESALARLEWPTATEAVLSRQSRFAARWGTRESDGEIFAPATLDERARTSVAAANEWLAAELRRLKERYPQSGKVALVGHAHIDTAWLWTLEETRRKVKRTFATVTELMRRYPAFRSVQSFAEYYRELEDDDPALLEQVKAQVTRGAWEPIGGFWVEPDINMPCGESLVRQALYGQLYFEKTFGRRHSVGWLPDTFGFSPALPQILSGAGLKSLFTIKIGWSETNRFPHTRFWWEGIDGSRVLVQMMNTPEDTYNGLVDPGSLLRAWRTHADKRFAPEVLQPIGHGDGGGGPTAQMIASQAILADFPLLPSTRWTTPEAYFDRAMEEALQTPLATWVGELYLEFHRGVLTSQGRTKRLHRQAERGLVAAEALAAFAALLGGPQPAPLAEAWRVLMINQFHDILPGSSIKDVYVRTERELGDVVGAADAAQAAALDAIASRIGTSAGPPGLLIVNPDLNERPVRLQSMEALPGGQPAEEGFVLASEARVPALGALSGRPAPASGVSVEPRVLENAFVRIEVGDDGALASVFDKRVSREALAGRGNQIWAYHDQPREYDAWDVEGDYQRSGEEVAADSIEIVESGPQRGALRIIRRVRSSTIVQSVRLWANSARLDFATRFDWRDRRLLLKARFPLAVRADYATFECAFGVCRRPTHVNTSWDAAKFEVPVHRFVDLSEPGYGVALLNDGRYGCHARGAELGLSLLRSPILPDRLADEGEQALTYALLPHQGDWIAGGVLGEAEDLNRSLPYARVDGAADDKRAFLRVAGQPVALGALKPAEDGDGLVLRVYEPSGARGPIAVEPPPGWRVAGEVSLLEDPIEPPAAVIRPFEIRSFRLRRA